MGNDGHRELRARGGQRTQEAEAVFIKPSSSGAAPLY